MNIAQGLAHAKKTSGTRQAVACGETRYTWEEFDLRTDALARGLASLAHAQLPSLPRTVLCLRTHGSGDCSSQHPPGTTRDCLHSQ